MKKILFSASAIVAVAAMTLYGTGAFFSDTETSTGNVFTAGAIDLTVDSEQHYNGNVCVWEGGLTNNQTEPSTVGAWVWQGASLYPVPGTYCYGSWTATNLGVQKFFNFNDIKPGDEGENTISLHINNNDAWLRMVIKDVTDLDNSCTEPESAVDPDGTTCGTDGELREKLLFSVWLDQGATAGFQGKCVSEGDGCSSGDLGEGDNVWQGQQSEPKLISAGTIDPSDTNGISEIWTLPTPLLGGQTAYFGVDWTLPLATGNEIQTDSMSATMEFQVEQYRNNPSPSWN